MPSLAVSQNGFAFDHPFGIASGAKGSKGEGPIRRALEQGWWVVLKTMSLQTGLKNLNPMVYAENALVPGGGTMVVTLENVELISVDSLDLWIEWLKPILQDFGPRNIVASIMESFNRDAWFEIIGRLMEIGITNFEINYGCPHGMPERKMGSAMGSQPDLVFTTSTWARQAGGGRARFLAKLTPNCADIRSPGEAALRAGMDGLSAINTMSGITGVDVRRRVPKPVISGCCSTQGGVSGLGIKPFGLLYVSQLAEMMQAGETYSNKVLCGIGGIYTAEHALEYIQMGAHMIQMCSAFWNTTKPDLNKLCDELLALMEECRAETLGELVGCARTNLLTYSECVDRQNKAK